MTPRDFFVLVIGAAVTAGVGAIFSAFARRGDEQRAAIAAHNEEQRRETGKRIGKLERRADIELGRRLEREAQRRRRHVQ